MTRGRTAMRDKPYNKVLKTCMRCRQYKTKCDAVRTQPAPCTACARRARACVFEVVHTPPQRSTEVVEVLGAEVARLKLRLGEMVARRAALVEAAMAPAPRRAVREAAVAAAVREAATPALPTAAVGPAPPSAAAAPTPPPYHEHTSSLTLSMSHGKLVATTTIQIPVAPGALAAGGGGPSCGGSVAAFILGDIRLTLPEASRLFENYRTQLHKYIPILPSQFLFDLAQVHQESDLLFWAIVAVLLLTTAPSDALVRAVQALVVQKCWYSTPRLVHTLLALAILTTWPLPARGGDSSELATKYLVLTNNLALQLGLHKLDFIEEFSHKTQVGILRYSLDNNRATRERIYKYSAIALHFWLTWLGYPQHHQDDYILARACAGGARGATTFSDRDDQYIDTVLKLLGLQLKLCRHFESLDSLVTRLYQINRTKRFIDIGVFERVLSDMDGALAASPDCLLFRLTLEYTRLQLYLFAFAPLDAYKTELNLSAREYRAYVYKALRCCYRIVELFNKEFFGRRVVAVAVQYRFALEMALLAMAKIYYSPLLARVLQYRELKLHFQNGYARLASGDAGVNDIAKVVRVLQQYEALFHAGRMRLLGQGLRRDRRGAAFYLLRDCKQSVATLFHEMHDAVAAQLACATWAELGLSAGDPHHRDIIQYLEGECYLTR